MRHPRVAGATPAARELANGGPLKVHWQGPRRICPWTFGWRLGCERSGHGVAPWFLAAGRPFRRSHGALLSGHITGHAPGTWCASSDLAQRRSLQWRARRGASRFPRAGPAPARARPGGAANGRCATSRRSASCRWLGPSLGPLMTHVLAGRLGASLVQRPESLPAPRPIAIAGWSVWAMIGDAAIMLG